MTTTTKEIISLDRTIHHLALDGLWNQYWTLDGPYFSAFFLPLKQMLMMMADSQIFPVVVVLRWRRNRECIHYTAPAKDKKPLQAIRERIPE